MNTQSAIINDRTITLSNLGKDLFPSYGFTKAAVIEYYSRMAPFILPHLMDRAVTLKRYPEGTEAGFFFEKRCPAHRPPWVKTASVRAGDKRLTACLANDLETLVWLENLAAIELHVPLSRTDAPESPDAVVFDLDPGEAAGVLDCARVALILKKLLENLRLSCCVKTSGKKGLHVYVPLNSGAISFENTRAFSKVASEILEQNYPDLVTARMAAAYREKKVFINWQQNHSSKTMVCVYSLRAGNRPIVSFPLTWEEVEFSVRRNNFQKMLITPAEAVRRTGKKGDLFRDMREKKQKLP